MGEFEDKLNSILGDQAAMSQIMALAQSLGNGGTPPQEKSSSSSDEETDAAGEPLIPAGREDNPLGILGSIDPKMIQIGMRLWQEYQGEDDDSAALLAALKPFLREKRSRKLDRAIQIAKLSRVIRVAFQVMGGKGDDDHV